MSKVNDKTNSKGILQKPGGHLHSGQHINFSAAEKAAADNAKTNQSLIPPAPKAPGPVGIITGADVKDEVELRHQGLIDVHGGHNAPQGQQEPATDKKGILQKPGAHLHDGQHINFSAAEKAAAENAKTSQDHTSRQKGGHGGVNKHQGPIPPAPKAPGPVGIITGADVKDEIELRHQGLIDVHGGHNAPQGQQEPATDKKGILQKPGGRLHDGQHINFSAAEKAAADSAKTKQDPIPPAPKAPGPVGIITGADVKDEIELRHQGLIDVHGGHNAPQGKQEPTTDKKGILQKPGGHLHDGQHINFSAAEKAAAEDKACKGPIPPAPKAPGPEGIITGSDVKDEVELHHQGLIDSHGCHNKPLGKQEPTTDKKGILQKPGGHLHDGQHINFSAAEKAAAEDKACKGPIPPAPKAPGPEGIISGSDVKDEVELHHQGLIDSHGCHNKPLGKQEPTTDKKGILQKPDGHLHDGQHINFSAAEKAAAEDKACKGPIPPAPKAPGPEGIISGSDVKDGVELHHQGLIDSHGCHNKPLGKQ